MIRKGTRVRYVRKDGFYDRTSGFYPCTGTLGTVVAVHSDGYEVRWDKGTREGIWYVNRTDVKETKNWAFLNALLCGVAIVFLAWVGLSWLEVVNTNLPDNPATPSAWNLFTVIFGGTA